MPDDPQEGPLFTQRATVDDLVPYFIENELYCSSEHFRGSGQVGRLDFACGAIVSLYAKGTALVQGCCTDSQGESIRALLRVAQWNCK